MHSRHFLNLTSDPAFSCAIGLQLEGMVTYEVGFCHSLLRATRSTHAHTVQIAFAEAEVMAEFMPQGLLDLVAEFLG